MVIHDLITAQGLTFVTSNPGWHGYSVTSCSNGVESGRCHNTTVIFTDVSKNPKKLNVFKMTLILL